MKAIVIVFVSFFFVENCGGRYHRGDLSYYNPRIPLKESTLWDEVCKDDPDYADACPEHAAIENYCKDQEAFMKKHCRKSCGLCSEETAKPPAPIVCEDDPDYADGCPKHAAIENYCKDQEEFMRKHCPKSCKFCSEGLSLQPASIECKDDPSYDCKDIAQTEGLCQEQEAFTKASCALSCGWCAPPTEKIPAPEICETDLPKWVHKCPEWADEGECDNPKRQPFMQYYCRKSCKLPCKPEPTTSAEIKPPSPPAFCSDRGANCAKWKSLGACESKRPTLKHNMAVYCGVTCGTCKEPTPEECYDKGSNCTQMKKEGYCRSTVPVIAYEVKTNCLETCEFCDLNPDQL